MCYGGVLCVHVRLLITRGEGGEEGKRKGGGNDELRLAFEGQ